MQRKVASRDGTAIAYWETGRGRPLVLVHGTTADHTRWDALRPFLEPHVTLVAMDRRGRGERGDTEPYALEREFEDVVAVVDAAAEASGGEVDLFGHSYGALCALEAARLTRNVRGLVLYEPMVLPNASPPGFHARIEALLAEGRRDDVVETFFRELLELPDEAIAGLRAHPSWRVRVAAAHTLPREDRAEATYRFDPARMRDVRTPTWMLVGGETLDVLKRSTETVAAALPDARVVALEGQGHLAMTTAPKLLADVLLRAVGPPRAG